MGQMRVRFPKLRMEQKQKVLSFCSYCFWETPIAKKCSLRKKWRIRLYEIYMLLDKLDRRCNCRLLALFVEKQ